MTDKQSIRDEIAKAIHDGPSAVLELEEMMIAPHPFEECEHKATYYGDADAILASPVIRRIQAEALREWARFQDQAIRDIAYAADDADRAEVSRWTVSARVYADRIERGETA